MFGWIGIIIGILLVVFGGFLVFLLPAVGDQQPGGMVVGSIILGFICLVIGGLLLFF